MAGDKASSLKRMVLVLVCAAFVVSGCAVRNASNQAANQQGAIEVFDAQAIPALNAGAAKYWYPLRSATVVIAVDRGKTDAAINGWGCLPAACVDVGINDEAVTGPLLMAAIAYGLEGDGFTLHSAAELLEKLEEAGNLVFNTFETPIVICFDYQAEEMKEAGKQIEVIIPLEGTLTYDKGLLSNEPLAFTENITPQPPEYENAARIADYKRFDYKSFNEALQDYVRIIRREVLHTRLYSSADSREHQFVVLVYIVLAVIWMASIVNRVMQRDVRRAALLAGVILLGWVVLRLIKYQLPAATVLARYLWYGFYLFQLALPLALLRISLCVDKPEGMKPRWFRVLVTVNALLFALVMTNDLHNLVFRLNMNADWSRDYGYGVAFYFVLAGFILPFIAAIGVLLFKSLKNPRRRQVLFPICFCAALAVYGYGYVNRIPLAWESDYTLTIGLFALLFLEAALRTGLIPVNTKYSLLFTHSTLDMRIIDREGNEVLSSHAAAVPEPYTADENTLIHGADIIGGRAFWREDISELNRLHNKTAESVKRLQAANAVLSERERVKRSVDEENARTALMSRLEEKISSHASRLTEMMDGLEDEPGNSIKTARAALLLCYLKRLCNLFFREMEEDTLPANELAVYLDELAEVAVLAGVNVIVTCKINGLIAARRAALFYDFFYAAIRWAAENDCANMLATLEADKNRDQTMKILPSAGSDEFKLDSRLEAAISQDGGVYALKDLDDDTVGISLNFPGGGEAGV
ncbi:MAG: hypothetical protein LBS19_02200 [Clostridiales bacterium]|jgi:uncharacterized membrane protein SirB2|nr:hypothetical protein [Clostridiales bacterium]